MKLLEIVPTTIAYLRAQPEFAEPAKLLDQTAGDYNKLFDAALLSPGWCLAIVPTEGSGDGDKPRIDLENSLLVCVVVNKAVYTAKTAFELMDLVLKTLHFASLSTEAPGRHQFTHAKPAWVLGPLDTGINTYFCNFRIKSLDTILAA
jgi:hypothetical protein